MYASVRRWRCSATHLMRLATERSECRSQRPSRIPSSPIYATRLGIFIHGPGVGTLISQSDKDWELSLIMKVILKLMFEGVFQFIWKMWNIACIAEPASDQPLCVCVRSGCRALTALWAAAVLLLLLCACCWAHARGEPKMSQTFNCGGCIDRYQQGCMLDVSRWTVEENFELFFQVENWKEHSDLIFL